MANRRHLIEEVLSSLHALRQKMKGKTFSSEDHITHSQWFVLGIIEQNNHASIKDISEMLGMSSSAATQLVDGLVKSDYVVREENPKDRRIVQLGLSSKGKKQISSLKDKHINQIGKLFDALNDSELETYLRLHKKIITSCLDKHTK